MSLQSNARRLVQARLGRAMTQPETETLDAALVEALGVLRVGTDEDHRTALQLVALTSLSTPAGAHLWACLLDEAEHTFQSVAAYAAAVVSAASAVASAQLAAALWLRGARNTSPCPPRSQPKFQSVTTPTRTVCVAFVSSSATQVLALAVSVALLVAHGHAAGARSEGMGLSACNGLPPPPCRDGAQAHVRVARVCGGVPRCHQR